MQLSSEMITASASLLVGVVAGGSALLGQRLTLRNTERAEVRRSALALAETRRQERLTHVMAFLEAVQAAERIAVDHHHYGVDDEQWQARANAMIDRLWVLQKTLHLLCDEELNAAARLLAFAVRDLVRDGPKDRTAPVETRIWEEIGPSRRAFLDVAHLHLRELAGPNS
ncbi:hypothetical protein ACFQO7_21530 [Catellatospora aurea]|uniref:Uncharacterized protein n=1 Tax=Catellatospora aurea TaxID=1337874 RepID=A0ABW2H1I1_9ACTN